MSKALSNEAPSNTYFGRAQAEPNEAGGRYAKSAAAHITGAGVPPIVAPEWSKATAVIPAEPPLGFDINELPDMTRVQS
jgi:hypothetical protein